MKYRHHPVYLLYNQVDTRDRSASYLCMGGLDQLARVSHPTGTTKCL